MSVEAESSTASSGASATIHFKSIRSIRIVVQDLDLFTAVAFRGGDSELLDQRLCPPPARRLPAERCRAKGVQTWTKRHGRGGAWVLSRAEKSPLLATESWFPAALFDASAPPPHSRKTEGFARAQTLPSAEPKSGDAQDSAGAAACRCGLPLSRRPCWWRWLLRLPFEYRWREEEGPARV